jgi:FlaA1/EpsC-like NDP-sugar epimerase
MQPWRQRLVVLTLLSLDVLLALLVWGAAFIVQSVSGQGALSAVSAAGIAPNIGVWVGLRALLGLYPGYGLDYVEELRRQTYAVAAALAITSIFALAFHVGDLLSRLLLVFGFSGLLVLAPLLRHVTKRRMIRSGLWGKPVVILGAGRAGERLLSALQRERSLGLRPIAVFDNRLLRRGRAVKAG